MGGKVRLSIPLLVGAVVAVALLVLAGPGGDADRGGGLAARFAPPAVGPSPAEARRIISPDFHSPLELRHNDRQVLASGPHGCEQGERWRVQVTITQGDALAKGHTQGRCSGRIGSWQVRAVARGPAEFGPGTAEGCARYVLRDGGEVTDTFTWCQELELVAQD